MSKLAIVNALGHVVQFVRADVPPGFQPPPGCTAVPEAALPAGYKMAAAPIPPVPESITASQARVRLIQTGVRMEAIDEAIGRIEDATTRESVRAWWEYEYPLRRDSPMLARWAVACGFSDAEVDDLFRGAAQVQS
jgi:hypothetical protein